MTSRRLLKTDRSAQSHGSRSVIRSSGIRFRAASGGDVTRFHDYKEPPVLFFPLVLIGIAGAASPDPRILSLVPPEAQLVAGISASSVQDQPDNFVLMTHNNRVDLGDFFALIGADSSRTIHQMVFVAMASDSGRLNEHSLLVSGNFDQPQIFKSAAEGGAVQTSYRGIPVLEIQPF